MKSIKKIHIIGMGALGILYGKFLTDRLGKEAVTFIGDGDRVSKYQQEGVCFNGEKCDFLMEQGGNQQTADLLIFAVKGTGLMGAIDLAKASVGEDTVVLSMLNGITSEEVLGQAYGVQHLVYSVVQGTDATKIGNQLTAHNLGELRIGALDDAAQKENLKRVRELFDRIGFPYTEEEDILRRLWSKWMLNVGCNQTVMVEEGTYADIQAGGGSRKRFIDAMREVIAVAQAEGVNLTESDIEEYAAIIDGLSPEGMPSMRQDGLAKRPSEVEMFSGTVIAKAEKYDIDVPVNRALYQRIREIEAAY